MRTDYTTVTPSSALEAASESCIRRLMHHGVEFVHPMELLAEAFET